MPFAVQDVQSEGRTAIDSPGKPNAPEVPPEEYALREYFPPYPYILLGSANRANPVVRNRTGDKEERAIIEPVSLANPKVIELQEILIDWVNDELAEQRIIVKHLEDDMYDGQVLHKLWEKLTNRKLDVLEVTQSEEGQRQKLTIVLNAVNHVSMNTI